MLTELGYKRLTYNEILDSKIRRAKELFGENIRTDETTLLGKFIRINAYDQALAEEEAEAIYYARFPNTATGVSLDRLCTFVGITRNSAIAAQYQVKVTGIAGETVPTGFLVCTESNVIYYNTQATEIGVDGTCTICVECIEAGTIGNVQAEKINTIKNPSAYVDEVIGINILKPGTDTESDYALRQRFNEAKQGQGACNENAIRSALLRVPTVKSASVVTNESETEDSAGRPPHSFECYIFGGEDYHESVAQTIFEKKPLGIKTYGKTSYDIIDDGGYTHKIYFSHVTQIDIAVKIKIKINNDFSDTTGIEEIYENITTYINNLGVGKNVILSSLYGKIHEVIGVTEVTCLLISKVADTPASSNIVIKEWEVPECNSVDVVIVI